MSTAQEQRQEEAENLILTLAVSLPRRVPRSHVRVTALIPTHPGAIKREWPLYGGALSRQQFDDLVSWIQQAILEGVYLKGITTFVE